MKTDYGWYGGDNGTNSSGFSGLPGGSRYYDNGDFYSGGNVGIWWSSSLNDSFDGVVFVIYRYLFYYSENFYSINGNNRGSGFSVRCVRDAE